MTWNYLSALGISPMVVAAAAMIGEDTALPGIPPWVEKGGAVALALFFMWWLMRKAERQEREMRDERAEERKAQSEMMAFERTDRDRARRIEEDRVKGIYEPLGRLMDAWSANLQEFRTFRVEVRESHQTQVGEMKALREALAKLTQIQETQTSILIRLQERASG